MRTVVFDLDGTLADTSGDLLDAANAVFRARGDGDVLEHGRDAGTALRGGRAMLTLGFQRLGLNFTQDDIDAGYPHLLEAYAGQIAHHTFLYDGAREVVDRLRAADYRVAVCTNKPIDLADTLLHALDFHTPFHAVVGARSLPVSKPDPAPYIASVERAGGAVKQSLLVGDSDTDRKTSAAAGVASVLVTFSPAGDSVKDLSPEAVIGHFDELDDAVKRLIG